MNNETKNAKKISSLNKLITFTLAFLLKKIRKRYTINENKLPKKRNSLPIVNKDKECDTKASNATSDLLISSLKFMSPDRALPLEGIKLPVRS